ncbi:hypothetical protein [Flavisolibacter nicotianae]|uniref:hypothetical protein n=1 Tax=Flavisolibacter nicotianae TaxID=2364882 RepID=UPI0013C4E8C1|nr:hypothetical protein [Flavisolibacter nicotianae]
MRRNQKQISVRGMAVVWFVLLNTIVLEQGFVSNHGWYKLIPVTFPLLLISILPYIKKSV